MSYQALYRAWRPDTFSEIVGQDAIVRTLRHQVTGGRIAHAYLFCGTRGTGKTTAAKVLSRAINCLNPIDGDPCGSCEVCRALKQENCMDVMEIDAASNNGVDEIRDLRDKIKYPPTVTRYKVYIIDEVHMLSTGAFNALLKTLEEPPAHAVFILATTEPQKLPATILSRCQRFDFHRIDVETIIDRLTVVLNGISRSAEQGALEEIARAAEGAMRDALSLLDVCLSYTDGEVTEQLARDVLGTAGRSFMFEFVDGLIACDAGASLRHIDEVMRRGCDPQVFLNDTVAHLRCVLLTGAIGANAADILEVTHEDAERFAVQAKQMSRERVTHLMDLFMRAEPDMKWASRPRTMLEMTAVRACHPEQEEDSPLQERLERVEKLIENGVSAAPAPKAAPPKEKPEPKPEPKKPAPSAPAVEVPPFFPAAIEKLSAENPSLVRFLQEMRFAKLQDDTMTVEFGKKAITAQKILEKKRELLEKAFSECCGAPVSLNMRIEGFETQKSASVSDVARRVINESYDVFGRENIELVE